MGERIDLSEYRKKRANEAEQDKLCQRGPSVYLRKAAQLGGRINDVRTSTDHSLPERVALEGFAWAHFFVSAPGLLVYSLLRHAVGRESLSGFRSPSGIARFANVAGVVATLFLNFEVWNQTIEGDWQKYLPFIVAYGFVRGMVTGPHGPLRQ